MERPERAGTSRRPSGRRREVSWLPVGSRSPSPSACERCYAEQVHLGRPPPRGRDLRDEPLVCFGRRTAGDGAGSRSRPRRQALMTSAVQAGFVLGRWPSGPRRTGRPAGFSPVRPIDHDLHSDRVDASEKQARGGRSGPRCRRPRRPPSRLFRIGLAAAAANGSLLAVPGAEAQARCCFAPARLGDQLRPDAGDPVSREA